MHFCGLSYDTRLYNKRLFKKQKTYQCTGSDPKSSFVAKLVLLLQKVASFRKVRLIVGVRYLESAHFGDFFAACGTCLYFYTRN